MSVQSLELINKASGLPSWIGRMMTNMRVLARIRASIVKSSPQNISTLAATSQSPLLKPQQLIKRNKPPHLNESILRITQFWRVWLRRVGKTWRIISTRRRSGNQSSPENPCSRLTFNSKKS